MRRALSTISSSWATIFPCQVSSERQSLVPVAQNTQQQSNLPNEVLYQRADFLLGKVTAVKKDFLQRGLLFSIFQQDLLNNPITTGGVLLMGIGGIAAQLVDYYIMLERERDPLIKNWYDDCASEYGKLDTACDEYIHDTLIFYIRCHDILYQVCDDLSPAENFAFGCFIFSFIVVLTATVDFGVIWLHALLVNLTNDYKNMNHFFSEEEIVEIQESCDILSIFDIHQMNIKTFIGKLTAIKLKNSSLQNQAELQDQLQPQLSFGR